MTKDVIRIYESFGSLYDLSIGDLVVCVDMCDSEDLLIFGKTYTIEDFRPFSDRLKLVDVPYFWYCDRFLQRKNMTLEEIQKYDDILIKNDSDKYNL